MAATNFSAFTFFGLSGAGYRTGYAFFPIMAYGTGFMALSFFIIGIKILRLSKERGYVTPSDYISDRYGSPLLRVVFSAVLVVFTLPYIAIQTIAAGNIIESLIGVSCIAGAAGGFPPGIWMGYLVLWFFANPMFPQLFQRFMAARDEKSIHWTAVLYPLICTFLFFITVSVGVMGKHVFPDLPIEKTDSIFPLLLSRYAGEVISALLLTGSVAALMSTLDSQLLTVSSIVIRDVSFKRIKTKRIGTKKSSADKLSTPWVQRLVIAAISAAGFLIALRPPDTILDFINKTSFSGLAVLAPTVIGGLYWRRGNRYGALSSIAAGEAMVLLFYFDLIFLPIAVLPIIPILLVSFGVYAAVSGITTASEQTAQERAIQGHPNLVFPIRRRNVLWGGVFLLFFILGNDFWNWNSAPALLLGLPHWLWYFFVLGILLSGAFALYSKVWKREK